MIEVIGQEFDQFRFKIDQQKCQRGTPYTKIGSDKIRYDGYLPMLSRTFLLSSCAIAKETGNR